MPEILIVCDAESHSPRVAKIETFTTGPENRWGTGALTPTPGHDTVWRLRPAQWLGPNATTGAAATSVRMANHNSRHDKITLTCPLCGLHVRARLETLQPYLWELSAAGLSQLTLAGLGAILSHSI